MNATRNLPFHLSEDSQLFDVDNFLAELERLAHETAEAHSFYAELLESVTLAMGARTTSYWTGGSGQLRISHQYRLDTNVSTIDAQLAKRLEETRQTGSPRLFTGPGMRGLLLASPVRGLAGYTGVLTAELTSGLDPESAERALELFAAIAEVAGDFELRRQVVSSSELKREFAMLEAFLLRVYGAWSVADVCRELAEEGRRLLGCDRLSVLVRSGRSWRVAAVSGVDSPSRRSDAVRGMERLVRVVAATGEMLVLGDETPELPPQVQSAVDDYFAGPAPRSLIVAPCATPATDREQQENHAEVTLVVEEYNATLAEERFVWLQTACNHAAVAVQRARAVSRLPFGRWFSPPASASQTKWFGRRTVLSVAAIAALGIAAAALTLVPAELEIHAEGRFVPTTRSRVFAPLEAVVDQVLVGHGERVQRGQPIIELKSPQLEIEIERVAGELATTRKEIAGLETARLRAKLPDEKRENEVNSVAAKLAALRELVASHERRLHLLELERERLIVCSPIDGEILSWKPEDYLHERPVARGERLVEIAATGGNWNIDLDVIDRRAGHILAAAESNDRLPVAYVFMSDPAISHLGHVSRIAESTQPDSSGQPVLRVEVRPEASNGVATRSGMRVAAKIHCGERSLGYVWFHDAWEAVQRRWF